MQKNALPINEISYKAYQLLLNQFPKRDNYDIKVLDNGCDGARAEFSIYLLKEKFAVTGIEINLAELFDKRNKFAECQNLKLVCGDSHRLPFKENYFDAVVMTEVLEHLDNPPLALRGCFFVLKNKGTLIITTPNAIGVWSIVSDRMVFALKKVTAWFGKKKLMRNPTGHVSVYKMRQLKDVLISCGFVIKNIYSSGIGISNLANAFFITINCPRAEFFKNIILKTIYDCAVCFDTYLGKIIPLKFHSNFIILCEKV